MTPPSNGQQFAYRRNPARTIHASTFQPQQFGHSHGYSVIPSQQSGHSAISHITAPLPVPSETSVSPAPPSPASSGFSLASIAKYANIDELKGLVNRFGGLDGILSTVTTVQKVMSTVGQIAPLVKAFTGGKKSADTTASEQAPIPARRRPTSTNRTRRSKSTSTAKRKTSSSAHRRPTKKSAPLTKRPANFR